METIALMFVICLILLVYGLFDGTVAGALAFALGAIGTVVSSVVLMVERWPG